MKRITFLFLIFITLVAKGQVSTGLVSFENLIELKGTPHVLGFVINMTTLGDVNTMNLMSINTSNGETYYIDLPRGTILIDFKQIKNDHSNVNYVAVLGRMFDVDKNDRINTKDPISLFIVTPDGKQKTDITTEDFFVRLWEVNDQTGTLIVTGFYDTNKNGRYDPTEKNEIQIFDLKTLKLLYKI